MKTFSERLKLVVGDRKPHTWAVAIGTNKSAAPELFAGRVPRMDTLSRIAHIERVSLTWLSDGTGAPFLVSELAEASPLLELLEAGADAALLLHDGSALCIALRTPIRKTYPRRKDAAPVELSYPEWVVFDVRCAYADAVAPIMSALESEALRVRASICTSAELAAITRGEVGNWQLFGDFAGNNPQSLWNCAQPADVPERLDVMLMRTVRQISSDTHAATLAIAAEPVVRYSNGPDVAELWARIPADRRPMAEAQLRLLAGETVKL